MYEQARRYVDRDTTVVDIAGLQNGYAGADAIESFAETIQALIAREDLDTYLEHRPDLERTLLLRAGEIARRAFADGDEAALYQAHKALYYLYEDNLRPPGQGAGHNQFNPFLLSVRGMMERRWERREASRIILDDDTIPTGADEFRAYFRHLCRSHPMVNHRLFDFLKDAASRDDLIDFFRSDAAVILRFCDLVVMSMVGIEDEIREELTENFWDEMGRGQMQERHVMLFRDLLDYVGADVEDGQAAVGDFIENLGWQGLAGYNLYLFLCLHRRNYFRSFGCLGAAEMMDSPQYACVVEGCRRVGLNDEQRLAYYTGHTELDVAHGDGWLENVLLPLVAKYPERRGEIVAGALMRMNVTLDYYDSLHDRLAGRVLEPAVGGV